MCRVLESLLLLRGVSGPFNLASGGFLAAPLLMRNCSKLPLGTQEGHGDWSLACKKWGTERPRAPQCPACHQSPF